MDFKSIMTFDKRILKLDVMSMDEQVFAEGSFKSGWILGIDESNELMYYDPDSGETVSVTFDGDRIMRSKTDSGSGEGGNTQPAPAAPVPAAPVPAAPVPAAPVPAAPLPAAPLPTLAATTRVAPTPVAPAPVAPAPIPPPGPTQIAVGIWQMPENAVEIAPGIFQIQ